MTLDFNRAWAENTTIQEWQDAQYKAGWAAIGDTPPTVEQFDAVLNNLEKKANAANMSLEHLIGVPLPYALETVPDGCLAMQGQAISAEVYPKLYAMYGGTLPDLRGEFIRGWDNGRGVDAGRELLTPQGDAIRNITGQHAVGSHYANDFEIGAFSQEVSVNGSMSVPTHTGSTSGVLNSSEVVYFDASKVVPTAHENRPCNIVFNYICIAG